MRRVVAIALTFVLVVGVPVRAQADGPASYIVQPGDTLYAIARQVAIPVEDLRLRNNLADPAALTVGLRLEIPPLDETRYIRHTVKTGETLFAIARLYARSEDDLRSLNLLATGASPKIGQRILVPAALPIPLKPGFGYGAHIYIAGNADELAGQITELGVNRVKIDVPWSRIEPERGRYSYEALDDLVRAFAATGAKLLLNVHDAPDWSRESYREKLNSALVNYGGPPQDLADFAYFMTVTAARYAGLVDAYEIWKAPNLLKYWNVPVYKQPPALDEKGKYGLPDAIALGASGYVELLRAAHDAIKAQDPSAKVITAGLAPVGFTDNYNSIGTDIYLEELLALGAADFADGIGAAFSASAVPPALPCCAQPPGVESHYESFIQNFGALMAYYAETLTKREIDLPLVLTQVGWGTTDGANLAVPATGYEWLTYTSQDEQALYVRQAYQLAQGMDKLDAMYLYNLNGCSARDREACFFSLVDADGARRPAFDAYAALPKSAGDRS